MSQPAASLRSDSRDSTPQGSKSRTKRRRGSVWWRLHQLAGLQFSLFLSFVFITGTFAVISHEIDWALRPAMWVSAVAENERVSWGKVLDSVQAYDSDISISSINAPIHSAAAFDIVVRNEGGIKHIYVDPSNAEVTGEGSWAGIQRFLRDSHRRIMIFETYKGIRIGILLVCLTSLYLLITLITSFYVYKKWWKGFFRLPKGKNTRSYLGDLHRWVGIWSLWFIFVMCYTGLWYLQAEIIEYDGYPEQKVTTQISPSAGAESLTLGEALDRAIDQSKEFHTDLAIEHVYFSGLGTDSPTFSIHGHTSKSWLVDSRANAILADGNTGNLIRTMDASTFDFVSRLRVTNNPLHFGTFAGYISKWLYFFFGLMLSGLSVTGVMIHTMRLAKSERTTMDLMYFTRNAWLGMGKARWLALGLTLFSFIAAPFLL